MKYQYRRTFLDMAITEICLWLPPFREQTVSVVPPPPIDPTKAAAKNIFVSVLAILFDFAFNVHSNMYSNKILGSISPSQVAILQVYTQQRNSLFSNLIPGSLFSNYYFCKNSVLCTVYLSFFEYLPCIYKSLLPLTDTRDTVPHAHRAVHRCGQLVS